MRILQILIIIFALTVGAIAQKAVLSGTVYAANGAVIPEMKIIATNDKGEKFVTISNGEGFYILDLPYNQYDTRKPANFKVAEYEIKIEKDRGFEQFTLKEFKFVPSYKGKMILDIALNIEENTICGPGGCIEDERQLIEPPNQKLSDKILKRPLENFSKAQNKTKRKNNK